VTEHAEQDTGADLREFVRPIWRRRWLVVAVVVVTTIATYVYNEHKPSQYRSSTQIFLQASEVDQALNGAGGTFQGDRNIVNQASLLRTPAIARVVAKDIGFRGDPAALLGAIAVTPSTGSDFLVISAVDGTSTGAATIANGFARAFIDNQNATTRAQITRALATARRQLGLLPVIAANTEARATLRTRISSLEALNGLSAGGAKQVDEATPGARFAPQPRRSALFGFALSLVLSILAAFGLERLDRRVKHLDEVDPAYDAPVLAALPVLQSGQATRSANGAVPEIAPALREAVRGLRTNLQLASPDKPLRTFLVTSGLAGEGKSTLVLNLALAYAEAGLRVAIIECDMRLPSLSKLVPVKLSPGLSDVLAGQCSLAQAVQRVEVGATAAPLAAVAAGPGAGSWSRQATPLTVLAAGAQPADPSSLLATDGMMRVLDSAEADSDIVLIDTPPLLAVSDALPLLAHVDGTIIVARIGTTNRAAGRRLKEIINRIPGATVLGVVANAVPAADFTGGNYYGYGFGYGTAYGSANGKVDAAPPAGSA
jgi:Mrp family chromosome partitioning ATPase/capsular polysaccharide biosynthesis protein